MEKEWIAAYVVIMAHLSRGEGSSVIFHAPESTSFLLTQSIDGWYSDMEKIRKIWP